jgi:hypothetical protein
MHQMKHVEIGTDVTTVRLKRAEALLHLFQEDCGRPAVGLKELSVWALAQRDTHLRFRVNRRLLDLLFSKPS